VASSGKHLTVIGAGPKAVALVAKREALRECGFEAPEIAVYDRTGVAANWRGQHGYTNGLPRLGTPPEKDIGFPYTSQDFGRGNEQKINTAMLGLSWAAYKIFSDRTEEGRLPAYADWIDRGRMAPRHQDWARYLDWVTERIGMEVRTGELSGMDAVGGRWRLDFSGGDTIETDGVVVTSPGPAKEAVAVPTSAAGRVLNGKSYWEPAGQALVEEVGKARSRVCVIGSGETAAAILVDLVARLSNGQIEVFSSDGIVFTRGESYEENRVYSNPSLWKNFDADARRKIVERTDRGVFSTTCKSALDGCDFVRTIGGRVDAIDEGGEGLEVAVGDERFCGYELVIDATGFRRSWFLETMTPMALGALSAALLPIDAEDSHGAAEQIATPTDGMLELAIDASLAVEGLEPRLHLPMFAAMQQGPGFASLGCLGILSDRILSEYSRPGAIVHAVEAQEADVRKVRVTRSAPMESESGRA
jgi:mycobactin lysine-N-oxygenase